MKVKKSISTFHVVGNCEKFCRIFRNFSSSFLLFFYNIEKIVKKNHKKKKKTFYKTFFKKMANFHH